jgi:hypothetical protein
VGLLPSPHRAQTIYAFRENMITSVVFRGTGIFLMGGASLDAAMAAAVCWHTPDRRMERRDVGGGAPAALGCCVSARLSCPLRRTLPVT